MEEYYKDKKPKTKTPEQAHQTMEWLCSKMERSVSDARRSLYKWGVTSREEQDKIISKLIKDGFINETRYAECYVRDKLIAGKWGVAKIRAGLMAKSIPSDIITQALESEVDKGRMDDKLYQRLQKLYESLKPKTDNRYELKAKLFRRAASQGFDIETINSMIERILKEDDE